MSKQSKLQSKHDVVMPWEKEKGWLSRETMQTAKERKVKKVETYCMMQEVLRIDTLNKFEYKKKNIKKLARLRNCHLIMENSIDTLQKKSK